MSHHLLQRYAPRGGSGGHGRADSFGRPAGGSWYVPWSDIMLTMFVLFAVLYVYGAAQKSAPAELPHITEIFSSRVFRTPAPSQETAVWAERFTASLASQAERVEVLPQAGVGVVLAFTGRPGPFAPGRVDLTAAGQATLASLAEPLALARSRVLVTAYAGASEDLELAARRAAGVVRQLSVGKKLPAGMFTAQAMTSDQPAGGKTLEIIATSIPY